MSQVGISIHELARIMGSLYIIRDRLANYYSRSSGLERAELEAVLSYLNHILTMFDDILREKLYDYALTLKRRACILITSTLEEHGIKDADIFELCSDTTVESEPMKAPPVE